MKGLYIDFSQYGVFMNQNKLMAELLFPNVNTTIADLDVRFPKRSEDAVVTRFAPSPTGFLHIGGVYTALMNAKIAHQSPNGVFMLRIEDTDKKREVPNSKGIICEIFNRLGVQIDEGVISETQQRGAYGSYIQSERIDIYHTVAKYLVEKGFAYPCFCSEEELNEIRDFQEKNHVAPGYYREYAKYRDVSYEVAKAKLEEKGSFVLRFRVPDEINERVGVEDLIKGYIEMENNINDFVLLKENGIPTYHFAHCCDDHFMGTTIPNLNSYGVNHGKYERNDFNHIVSDIAPSLSLILSACPETYSYTLTESWMAGLPVVASDLGALRERISSTGGGWLVDYTDINGIYDLIININQEDYENKLLNISKIKFNDVNEMCDEYIALYNELID